MKKVLMLIGVIAFASCSTVFSENEYGVTVTSSPESAKFAIYNSDNIKVHAGRTPARVQLEASEGYFQKAKYTVKFEKEGYEPTTTQLKGKLGSSYFANILFIGGGGLIAGLIIDPATGNMWYLPKFVSGNLTEKEEVKK